MAKPKRYSGEHGQQVVIVQQPSGSGCLKWLFIIFVLIPILGIVISMVIGAVVKRKVGDIELTDPQTQEAPAEPGEDR